MSSGSRRIAGTVKISSTIHGVPYRGEARCARDLAVHRERVCRARDPDHPAFAAWLSTRVATIATVHRAVPGEACR
jgi:hypothetical protein